MSIEALARAMQAIDLLPKPSRWIVIDPHGKVYEGTVEQMTLLLVQEHPLMRTALDLTVTIMDSAKSEPTASILAQVAGTDGCGVTG